METDRLRLYETSAALDRGEERLLAAGRPADRWTEVTPGGPPYRLLWCRIGSGAPGDPPDERYFADEVRPTVADAEGHLAWELVPDGLRGIVVHNVAEAGAGTHALAADTILRVEERLDRAAPPSMVYLAHVAAASDAHRLARIVSFDGDSYTVQPVRRESAGIVDDGDPIAGVPNLGELWDEEAGYLAGPASFDRYVRIFQTPAGWAMLLHPPRMV